MKVKCNSLTLQVRDKVQKILNIIILKRVWFYQAVMYLKDPDGMANGVDLDQTAPSGSTFLAKTCLSEHLEPLN